MTLTRGHAAHIRRDTTCIRMQAYMMSHRVALTTEKIDPILGKVSVAEEDDDGMRRPADFGDDTDVTEVTSGTDRGTIPTSGVLCTPTVRNLFSEWIRKVKELGSLMRLRIRVW